VYRRRKFVQPEPANVVKTWRESKSAKKPGKRNDFSEMMSMIETGKINAILCWQINRLVRNMKEGGALAQMLIDGQLQEIRTPFAVYRTGDNIISLVNEAASAMQFSLDHTFNVNRGMKGKFSTGGCNYKAVQGYMNARDPLNFKIGIVLKDPQRFDLIRKVWDMFLTGAYTAPQVIRTLNDVWGYRTRRTKKLPSSKLAESYGYQMFSNPFYMGFVQEKGKLVRSLEIEPMVTPDEFARAQVLRDKGEKVKQTQKTHEHAYTGLMVCGYCGSQITAEKRLISTGEVWENYHCSDSANTCTKRGMARKHVEFVIIHALDSITVDAGLCVIALENIVRDLESQTGAVQSLYEQQSDALQQAETQLNNLADMWIRGLINDEELYQQKEKEIRNSRDKLLLNGDQCRNDLERMRANAMAASNYVVFARDNFVAAEDRRKREIAHALGIKYSFYGREKEIRLELHPLLVETVKFVQKTEAALALREKGLTKGKTGDCNPALAFGGPYGRLLELPTNLLRMLRESDFHNFYFA
jgi:site-specific DNA recombinase